MTYPRNPATPTIDRYVGVQNPTILMIEAPIIEFEP